MSQWQYLDFVEPVLPTPRGALPAQVEPLDAVLPRRLALPLAVTLAVSVLVWVAPPTSVTLAWHPPLDTPTKRAAWVPDYRTGAERPCELPQSQHITWYQPLTEPRLRARTPAVWVTGAECPVAVPVVQALDVEWARPLETPTPQRRVVDFRTGAERPVLPTVRAALPRIDWYVPLSVPPRRAHPALFSTGADHLSPVTIVDYPEAVEARDVTIATGRVSGVTIASAESQAVAVRTSLADDVTITQVESVS